MFPYRATPAYPAPAPAAPTLGGYTRLLEPLVLVTTGRGREVFADSRRFFSRLDTLSADLAARPGERQIMALWHGRQCVESPGIEALETMLRRSGLVAFNRACKARSGPERAIGSKYQLAYLGEYLGWEWARL